MKLITVTDPSVVRTLEAFPVEPLVLPVKKLRYDAVKTIY